VAIASGAAIVIATIAVHSFSGADAGERATDLVRRELTTEGLARHRADFELSKAALEQLYLEALPAFALELGLTPAEFEQQVLSRYPTLAQLAPAEVRAAGYEFAEGIVANLENHQTDFVQADAIPVGWLPMTAGPWLAVAFGAVLVAAGLLTLLRPSRLALWLIAVLGIALIVGPLVVRFPQKASAARDLLESLTFSTELAAETRVLMETAEAATVEVEERLFPDMAAALEMTPAQLDALVAQRYPAIATARGQFDEVFQRYEVRVQIRERAVGIVPEAQRYPLTAVSWWAFVPGALTALAAGAALARRSRRSAA
jgi:hypothetical protein